MFGLTRRTFVGWMGSLGALIGFGPGALTEWSRGVRRRTSQRQTLSERELLPLGEAVLPSELGPDGVQAAVREFSRWLAAYRPEAELLHGYGTGEIGATAPSPEERWRRQLAALDADAKQMHGGSFASANVAQRQSMVRVALGRERIDRMPSPLSATHVSVALIAHFFGSSAAHDLCYGAQIGRNTCRPLVNAPKEPVPLSRRRAGP